MPVVPRRIRVALRSARAVPAAVSHAMPRRLVDGVLVAAAFALVASLIADRAADPARTVALVVLGVALAGLGFWKVPQWQAEAAHRREPKRSRFDLENEARK